MALIRETLEEARGEGAAVFFSSHQLHEVEQLCDRAAFLHEGRLLQSGSMAGLLREGATALISLRGLTSEHPFVQSSAAWLKAEPARSRGDLIFAVPLAEQRAFLERAWAAGAELLRVEREHRTLEDLFASVRGHGTGVSYDR